MISKNQMNALYAPAIPLCHGEQNENTTKTKYTKLSSSHLSKRCPCSALPCDINSISTCLLTEEMICVLVSHRFL